ncbi:MAG: hypothetical protein C0413_01675 [Clostridiales bacterium]|nr:hypothetical protein [Clostridiales bacterium]
MTRENGTGINLMVREQFLAELRTVNETSSRYGLTLSEKGMQEISQARTRALFDQGRVELGKSAVKSIADGFCDSPYLMQEDYEATLLELVDAFYYFKNACEDQITDDELIQVMRERYDAYAGSVEAVAGTSLETICRARRFGLAEDAAVEDEDDERDDE